MTSHTPVMVDPIIRLFSAVPAPYHFLDATFGRGGHTQALLEAFPQSYVTAIDRDPEAIAFAQTQIAPRYPGRFSILHGPFSQVITHLPETSYFSGILFDLGVSSPQLEDAHRGFSFLKEGPLDMRMGQTGRTAADILRQESETALANILYQWGEERCSRKIARALVQQRQKSPLTTTTQLAHLIAAHVRPSGRIHPATRTFQALRIAVNQELDEIQQTLPQAARHLNPGGCLAVMAFHSLEDRLSKVFFRTGRLPENQVFQTIAPKPLRASADEIRLNPRARSACLRWGYRI